MAVTMWKDVTYFTSYLLFSYSSIVVDFKVYVSGELVVSRTIFLCIISVPPSGFHCSDISSLFLQFLLFEVTEGRQNMVQQILSHSTNLGLNIAGFVATIS